MVGKGLHFETYLQAEKTLNTVQNFGLILDDWTEVAFKTWGRQRWTLAEDFIKEVIKYVLGKLFEIYNSGTAIIGRRKKAKPTSERSEIAIDRNT